MSAVWVSPGTVSGTVLAPASKSYTHRAVVAAALTGNEYRISNPLVAEDTLATARAVASLGFTIRRRERVWTVRPAEVARPQRKVAYIDCRRSGTTLRLMTALAATRSTPVRFGGDAELVRRPMAPLIAALRKGGVRVEGSTAASGLPFEIQGPLRPIDTSLRVDASSQFVSALLFVLPILPRRSRLRFRGEPVSYDYIQATAQVLRAHRIRCSLSRRRASVPGDQRYRGRSFHVPGDASSSAYLWAAAAVSSGQVRVRGIEPSWAQADLAILPILEKMGARVRRHADGATVEGNGLSPVDIDLTDSPDLYPLVAVLAAVAPGTSHLRGARHVVFKESDRRASAIRLVRALGGRSSARVGDLRIEGTARPRSFRWTTSTDHRVVMAAAVGALVPPHRSQVGRPEAVHKSYPEYWTTLRRIGARTEPVR